MNEQDNSDLKYLMSPEFDAWLTEQFGRDIRLTRLKQIESVQAPEGAERIPAIVFPPSDFIKEELTARGWDIETFAAQSFLKKETAEELISGYRRITPLYAYALSLAFGTGEQVWLNLQRSYDEMKKESR